MKCYIIAGANGAGKTTFAKTFLPSEGECLSFVNADLIAAGLSPFQPESVAFEAGRLLLKKIDNLILKKESFAFETTLSGRNYLNRIKKWREAGYEVILYYLKLHNEKIAIERVSLRVSEGGHNISEKIIRRRYQKGLRNLPLYQEVVNSWVVFDNSGETPFILKEKS